MHLAGIVLADVLATINITRFGIGECIIYALYGPTETGKATAIIMIIAILALELYGVYKLVKPGKKNSPRTWKDAAAGICVYSLYSLAIAAAFAAFLTIARI